VGEKEVFRLLVGEDKIFAGEGGKILEKLVGFNCCELTALLDFIWVDN